jgi:hypothetical protein
MDNKSLALFGAIVEANVRDLAWTNARINESDREQYLALARAFLWLYKTADHSTREWVNRDLGNCLDALAWRYEELLADVESR